MKNFLKKISLFCILAYILPDVFISKILAQTTLELWLSEDFSNSNSGFVKEVTTANEYDYKDGKYQIKNKGNGEYSWSYKGFLTKNEEECIIETEFSITESNIDNAKHGLVIVGKDKKVYLFGIMPKKGIFKLEVYQDKFTYLTDEIPVSSIKNELNEINKIWINITPQKLIVKINNKEVYSGNNPKDFTGSYGFFTAGPQNLAVDNFNIYRNLNINLVPNAPTSLEKENLGNIINTKYNELLPYISSDGKTLYYSSQYNHENTGGEKDSDEIWYSESNDGGKTWQTKKNMGKPLNNFAPNFIITSSPDNNTLLIANTYKPDGSSLGGGISIANRTASGWEVPVSLEVENFVSNSTNEFCLSTDRKVIIMAVLRDECIGRKDMFVTFNLGGNKWSKPKNMGNIINTKEDESSPFLAADGVSLYFSSPGFAGYGSNDIFVSKRLDDTWTNWSTPQNLGKGINSDGWDAYFTIPASGNYAYVVSNKNGIEGSTDILRIKLPEALKPKPVVLISGKVYNSKTKEPMFANISYSKLKTNQEIGVALSNPVDGNYKIVLPAGEFYGFLAQKNDFISVSENFDVSEINEYKEITRDLYLTPVEVGQVIRLNNIFFDFSKAILRNESFGDLDRLVEVLRTNPNMKIEVAGHTDNLGSAQGNLILSQNRAQSVVDYLIKKNIAKDRLIANGYGLNIPTSTNSTEEGRQKNRRVEFKIMTK